jgi:hypothetical protein
MVRLGAVAGALLAILAIPVGTASANAYANVLQSYERAGTVDPCRFTSAQLASALGAVDPAEAQYFGTFTTAVDDALAARARGQCATAPALQRVHAADVGSGAAALSLPAGSPTAATNGGPPLAVVLMALSFGALGIVLAIAAVARMRGWDPAWLASWRHACGEAGYRLGGSWAQFGDRLHRRRPG